MKKNTYVFQNKTIFKCLILILVIFLRGSLYFLNSYKNNISIKSKQKDKSVEIHRIVKKADLLFEHEPDSSYFYFNKAIQLCDPKLDYLEDYIYSLTSIANLQQNAGNYISSEETLTKTLPYLKKLKNPKFTYNVYTITAFNYHNTYDNNSALYYHAKALKLAKKPFKKAEILTDIASVYLVTGQYKKVIEILEPLNTIEIKHDTDSIRTVNQYSMVLDYLGLCYYRLGNPKALAFLTESLKIKLKYRLDFESMTTYKYLAIFYEKTNLQLSKMYAKKSYQIACKVNSTTFKLNGLALLIKKTEGNELKKYASDYIKIADSLNTVRRKAKNQFSTIKYDARQNKEENQHLKSQRAENELQLERQKNRNIISYVIIVVILGGITFLYFYLKSKGKREKKQAIFESEIRISNQLRNQLTKEVYNTLIFAQNKDPEKDNFKETLLNNLDLIYSKTRNISKENSPIITDKNYSIALKEMISGFKTTELNILLNGLETIPFEKIEKNKKIIIYRVLQELLINMQKHSYASLIGISFKKTNKNFIVTYNDNGNGIDLQNLSSKNGLQNIENRILSIKGAIDVDSSSGKGFKVFIKIPK